MSKEIKETPFYVCSGGCTNVNFYQDGILQVTRNFSEDGEKVCDDEYFEYASESEMRCWSCGKVAIKKIKKVTTEFVKPTTKPTAE